MRHPYLGICLFSCLIAWKAAVGSQDVGDVAKEADGIASGLGPSASGVILLNEKTGRIEVRDDAGLLVEEVEAGTAGRSVDVAGQEYRISFGKDDLGRRSVLLKAGPAMRKPITVDLFGRKAVLSPDASLLATLTSSRQVLYEPSICGQVYYIENIGGVGSQVSRPAGTGREVAVLAKPASPNSVTSSATVDGQEDSKSMEKAGQAVKSVFCAVLGLPDKEATGKAKVYRLRSNRDGAESSAQTVPSVQ